MYTIFLTATFLKQHLYLFIEISIGTNTTYYKKSLSISNIEINSCIALLIPDIDLYKFYYISYLDSVNTSLNP